MLAQPIDFGDPEATVHIGYFTGFHHQHQGALQLRETEPTWDANHDDAGVVAGSVLERVREIQIKRHEATAFRGADGNEPLVRGRQQTLVGDGQHIEVVLPQKLGTARAKVLIEFDLHAAPRPITTTRSRVISEP